MTDISKSTPPLRHGEAAAARQIPVPQEPLLSEVRFDYADAFEIALDIADARTAEEFARSCLEEASAPLRAMIWRVHRHVLRFRLEAPRTPDHVLGWSIRLSQPDVVELTAVRPLLDGFIVGRRTRPDRCQIITAVHYKHAVAPIVMTAVGPIHRRVAPRLLGNAVAARQA